MDLSPRAEEDDWNFTIQQTRTIKNNDMQTTKRRKPVRMPSGDIDSCASQMQHMDLDAAPLGVVSESPLQERRRPSSRMSATGTAIRNPAGAAPTARRLSNVPKQPLGLDITFGNSHSTVRHFKRVASDEKRAALSSNPIDNNSFHPNPYAKTFRPSPPSSGHLDYNDENSPPAAEQPPIPVTKDALFGRRAYSKALDSVFQEAYADSASYQQREALGRVHQAWAYLDQVDPQGEFLLLKSMVDRLQGDAKLASALGISVSPSPTPLSKPKSRSGEVSLGGTTIHGAGTTRIRANTAVTASPLPKTSTEYGASPPAPGSPAKGAKLVLAHNNPHLKSHRRRQSTVGGEKPFSEADALNERKLPGYVEKGMEQQGLLSDILYGQWMQGLRSRWPLA